MNFKLKALVAAAVVATTMSGAANALTNNEMFLVAYDAAAQKTFIAALGQAGSVSAFTGDTNLSVSYAADSNWTNFITGATAGGVTYQVLGFNAANPASAGSYVAGDRLLATSNVTPAAFSNTAMNKMMLDVVTTSGLIGGFEFLNSAITGSSTGLVVGVGSDSGAKVGTNIFTKYSGFDATAALGDSLYFYDISRTAATGLAAQTAKTQFMQGPTNLAGDTWNLSSSGQLVYTAAVPEADSWAMAMLGLGLMGFVARRRTRA